MESVFLTTEAIDLVKAWLERAGLEQTRGGRQGSASRDLMADPDGVEFAMWFVDRVMRIEDDRTAAEQLRTLVDSHGLPGFVSGWNRWGLWIGTRLGPLMPGMVIPLARRRLRSMVGHLVLDARPGPLRRQIRRLRASGFAVNVSLLGESILGEKEARRHLEATCRLVEQGDVDYVSIRVSGMASQLNYWDWEGSLDLVKERVRALLRVASSASPPVFVNWDMEEYHDLEVTLTAFKSLLSEPEFHEVNAGIVLQAYLPETITVLQDLVAWAAERQLLAVERSRCDSSRAPVFMWSGWIQP